MLLKWLRNIWKTSSMNLPHGPPAPPLCAHCLLSIEAQQSALCSRSRGLVPQHVLTCPTFIGQQQRKAAVRLGRRASDRRGDDPRVDAAEEETAFSPRTRCCHPPPKRKEKKTLPEHDRDRHTPSSEAEMEVRIGEALASGGGGVKHLRVLFTSEGGMERKMIGPRCSGSAHNLSRRRQQQASRKTQSGGRVGESISTLPTGHRD